MKLNPTQDFIRTFFTPASPYKGILLWHSVGTGKTCSAIATATSTFEQEGYTILWVTRTTLKSDVYKNMFDDVCHMILAERMKKDGMSIPEDPVQRKRLLSKNWIDPISYKTFSNLLTPGVHNEYMDKLIARNGHEDILRKTLIVIDEAHKLYGSDLKAAERPNMEVMERLLQKSYDFSGKDSARLLIMTATPFTNSPMELFQLINLCKETSSEKIPTDIKEFKNTYMRSSGEADTLSEAGTKKLADKLSGYISYLNREQDPTQFAQPVMIEVPVIMSHIEEPDMRQQVFAAKPDKASRNTKKADMKGQLAKIKTLKQQLKETQKRAKEALKNGQARCKTIKNRQEKANCMADAKRESEAELKETIETLKAEIAELTTSQNENKIPKEMKAKITALRKSLLQEVILMEKCKHMKLA